MALRTKAPGRNDPIALQDTIQEILDLLNASDLEGVDIDDALLAIPFKIETTVVAGAAAATNIAVAGTNAADDKILSVLCFDVDVDTGTSATGNKVQAVTNLTSEAAITTNGNIQLSTTVTTGDTLVVVWWDKSAVAS